MPLYISIDSVAARYETSRFTIYRWLRDDPDFPRPIVTPTGGRRYSVAALDEWDAKRPVAA